MQAKDHCLILAAGFGTRMGEIGKVLPKVMWPVFHKSLLETQVLFARSLGYEKIYINVHHQAATILEMTQGNASFKNIFWLKEFPEILDIGGGVHNLASQPEVNYTGRLLVLNADQILWFTKANLKEWMNALDRNDGVLLSLKVQSQQGYNQLVTERGFLKSIKPNKEIHPQQEILTYSGNAIINLSTLKPQTGSSKFFDSVCSFDRKNVCIDVSGHPYWDFGTKKRYFESLKRIIRERDNIDLREFYDFLTVSHIFNANLANPQKISYNSHYSQGINLTLGSNDKVNNRGVLISGKSLDFSEKPSIRYNEIVDYLD
jgi:NDP-sugar pyrophosphorylase family protein